MSERSEPKRMMPGDDITPYEEARRKEAKTEANAKADKKKLEKGPARDAFVAEEIEELEKKRYQRETRPDLKRGDFNVKD